MYQPQPARTPVPALTPKAHASHAPKARPDARPMRLALSGGGIAVLSALAAAIVLPPRQAAPAFDNQQAAGPVSTAMQVQRPVRYVQLSPGETAPPGATVIDAAAPTPQTVVVTITAAPQKAARGVVRTSQSGKVGP